MRNFYLTFPILSTVREELHIKAGDEAMRIICNTYIKKEQDMYSAVCIEFGIASCGYTIEEAYENVIEAVEIHLHDARELGTLNELLTKAGFDLPENPTDDIIIQPEFVMFGSPFVAEVA